MLKLISTLAIILWLVTACKSAQQAPAAKPPQLHYTNVIESSISNKMVFVAETRPNFLYTTQPRVSGYLLVRHFANGAMVQKGQLLYSIDPSQYSIALAQSKADLAASVAELKRAELDYQRNVPLAKINAVSQSTLDQITAQWLSAQEDVRAKQESLKQAELDLSYTKIYAPATGIASSSNASEGDYVGLGTEFPILNYISQIDKIEVIISIPMSRYLEITYNNEPLRPNVVNRTLLSNIKMELSDGSFYDIEGQYDYTKSSINSSTNAIELSANFPNPKSTLRSGQFVKIHCNVGEPSRKTLIPQKAIFRTQNINLVYLVRNGVVEVRPVELGDPYDQFWIVESGVEKGDKVLTEGFYKAHNGMKVDLQPNS